MKFPNHIDDDSLTDAHRASARLKFILNKVAADLYARGLIPRQSIKALALYCEIDNSTLCYGLRLGRLTDRVALRLVEKIRTPNGEPLLRYEDLRLPLRIMSE